MKSATAQNVKEIIKENGLKQSYIAEKAGYTKNQFNAMLNGRKIITDVDVMNIAGCLGVPVNRLFKKEE